jgi:hypothetical protein
MSIASFISKKIFTKKNLERLVRFLYKHFLEDEIEKALKEKK